MKIHKKNFKIPSYRHLRDLLMKLWSSEKLNDSDLFQWPKTLSLEVFTEELLMTFFPSKI